MTKTSNVTAMQPASSTGNEYNPEGLYESLALKGDLSGLSPQGKVEYYRALCERLKLDPATQPFLPLSLNGKVILYASKAATDQLARVHHVNRTIVERQMLPEAGVYVVIVRAELPDGRSEDSSGAVSISGKGEQFANALMKCETKAKRRATLSILGLGMLDESEIESIPGSRKQATNFGDVVSTPEIALTGPGDDHSGPGQAGQSQGAPESLSNPTTGEKLSAKQLGALRGKSKALDLDLNAETKKYFGCRPDELNRTAASMFLDHLKNMEDGGPGVMEPGEWIPTAPTTEAPAVNTTVLDMAEQIRGLAKEINETQGPDGIPWSGVLVLEYIEHRTGEKSDRLDAVSLESLLQVRNDFRERLDALKAPAVETPAAIDAVEDPDADAEREAIAAQDDDEHTGF